MQQCDSVPAVSKGLASILLLLNLLFNFLCAADLLLPSAMWQNCRNSSEANVIAQGRKTSGLVGPAEQIPFASGHGDVTWNG